MNILAYGDWRRSITCSDKTKDNVLFIQTLVEKLYDCI